MVEVIDELTIEVARAEEGTNMGTVLTKLGIDDSGSCVLGYDNVTGKKHVAKLFQAPGEQLAL